MQQRGESGLAPARGAEEAGCAAVERDGAGVQDEVATRTKQCGGDGPAQKHLHDLGRDAGGRL